MDFPDYPHNLVDKKVTEMFGFTKDELSIAFEKKWNLHYSDIEWGFRCELEGLNNDLSEDDLERLMDESNDPRMVACREIREQTKLINELVESIPEVILWNQECDKVRDKEKEEEAKICFAHSPLNRPGVLIEVQSENSISRYLIGDINHLAGVCDDCTAFDDNAIVLRAQTLIPEEGLNGI